jgi:hypothetical protein
LLEAAVAENLQIHQAQANCATPQDKNAREEVEATVGAVAGCASGHEFSLRKTWRPVSRQFAQNKIEIVISSEVEKPAFLSMDSRMTKAGSSTPWITRKRMI